MAEYSEPELVIPALEFIRDNPGTTTTEIIDHLTNILRPSGHDAEINPIRGDTYFSQKVRNLKSHYTLEKHNWVRYQRVRGNGIWHITSRGRQYLQSVAQ